MSNENCRIALPSGKHLCIHPCRTDRNYPAPAADEILVIDDRSAVDPSFQIRDSYRIVSKKQREEILLALIDYAAANPLPTPVGGQWQRTVPTMEKEWLLHNIAYGLHILRSSSMHVDLNNAEEIGSLRSYARRAVRVLLRYAGRRAKR